RNRRLNRFKDLLIPRAATEISRQRFADLIARRMRMLVQQRLRRDEESRRAVAALRGAEIGERFLKRMEPTVSGESFDRRDAATLALHTEHETREDRLIVEQDGARTALAELAAVLRPAEIQVLAQHFEQRLVRRERDFR